nr:hypothetical protein [uncultured Roseateles sp.]
MTEHQIRQRLKRCNLSKLAELADVNVRNLRAFRNDPEKGLQRATREKIIPHLDAATVTDDEAKRVRASVPKQYRR